MKKKLMSIPLLACFSILGCNTANIHMKSHDESHIGAESIGTVTTSVLGNKMLHTNSAMQILLLQSKGFTTQFSPDSDDIFLENDYAEDWFGTLLSVQNQKGVLVTGNFIGEEKRYLKIKNFRASIFTSCANSQITVKSLTGANYDNKFLFMLTKDVRSLLGVLKEYQGTYDVRLLLDKLYSVAHTKGVSLYFSLDKNARVLSVGTTPFYSTALTPYKRQFFINFLNARGIRYLTKGNSIAIADNFSAWVVAMKKLEKLNKYSNAVYGIYDGQYFFEIADGTYQETPINIELIDWIPGGKREYNIYAKGYNRKITTSKQFYSFYVPDGSKKYIIRFY